MVYRARSWRIYLVVVSVVLAACRATPESDSVPPVSGPRPTVSVTIAPATTAPTATAAPVVMTPTRTPLSGYQDATYLIDGQAVTLVNGMAEGTAAPGSTSKITTRYFGNAATGDLNGDGREDATFLLTQEGGGSGTFYYLVAALNLEAGWVGTDALFLGDRIAPQTTRIDNGIIQVTYADRTPQDSFAVPPSVAVSRSAQVTEGLLVELTAPR